MKTHTVLHLLVFTCYLVIGYTLSIRYYQPDEKIVPESLVTVTTENQATIATMKNGQRNILLINTDSIDAANPKLISLWLLTYLPEDTTIQLLPIYPTGKQLLTIFEKQLDLTFTLVETNGILDLDQGFTSLLEKNNYWWSGYIIYDDVALINTLDLIGGLEINGKTLNSHQLVEDFAQVIDDAPQAYSAQVAFIQSVCYKLMDSGSIPNLLQLFSSVHSHILTNLDTSQLQMDLKTVSVGERNPTCRFPTLEISRIEP